MARRVWWTVNGGAPCSCIIKAGEIEIWDDIRREIWRGLGPEATRPAVSSIHLKPFGAKDEDDEVDYGQELSDADAPKTSKAEPLQVTVVPVPAVVASVTNQDALQGVVASIERLSVGQQRILEVVVEKEKSIPLSKITKTKLGKLLEVHLIDFTTQPVPAIQPALSFSPFSWSALDEDKQSEQYLSYLSKHLSTPIAKDLRRTLNKSATLYDQIELIPGGLNVSGKYDVGITAGVCPSTTSRRQSVFIALELKKTKYFHDKEAQGEATAIVAALHSSLRVVTVYTDLNDNWWLMWYVGGAQKTFASLSSLTRAEAVSLLRVWIDYNNNHVKGEFDASKVPQPPPPPFQDIKKFLLQAAAEPLDMEDGESDDEIERMSDLIDEDEMNQWLVEQLIRRSIGPHALKATPVNDPLRPVSSVIVS